MRIIAIILVILSIFTGDVTATEFIDVDGHWAEGSIKKMMDIGVIKGINSTEFVPEGLISRAEFATIVVRAMNYEKIEYMGLYVDVSQNDWFAKDISTMAQFKLISGYDGRLEPNKIITKEQAAKILVSVYEREYKMAPSSLIVTIYDDYFLISEWAVDYVNKATMLGFIKGYNELLKFDPQAYVTRAQAADMMFKLLKSIENSKKVEVNIQ